MMFKKEQSILVLALSVLALSGCADPTANMVEMPTSANKTTKAEYTPSSIAGIQKDLSKSQDPNRLKGLIASMTRYGRRANPFALTADEIAFDKSQASERLLAEDGDFGARFELPEDKGPTIVVEEPQPYRRLSGVVIGDAVYAILEENGVSFIVRPGQRLPNSQWRVASIDRDKAVLIRDGDVLPKEVEVRLETAPPGFGGQGAGGGGAAGGGRPASGGGGRAGGGGGAAGISGS
jgi:uncharacterized membrane protein YgcG